MNLYEFCDKYGISQRKAKRLEKDGLLSFDVDDTVPLSAMRHSLGKGNALTPMQLIELIENPKSIPMLGRYAGKARDQIADLGDLSQSAAPIEVVAALSDAARGDPEAVHVMCDWLRRVIPSRPVGHSYVAIRLLLGMQESIRQYEAPRITLAMLHCRKSPKLAGWWRSEPTGSRKATVYERPSHDL